MLHLPLLILHIVVPICECGSLGHSIERGNKLLWIPRRLHEEIDEKFSNNEK
jgi:hypothetical protein